MIIYLKNKHTLKINEYEFKCSIGKNGLSDEKIEGDKKTPIGLYKLGDLYYRADKIEIPNTLLNCIKIKPNMGWCDDVKFPKKYNKLIKIDKKISHEKLYRNDSKYDLLIPIIYNSKKTVVGKGSCIFLHLTKSYKSTAGCIALNKKDFLIMLKLINKKSKIKINQVL
jgi:L,D-peptidoglycan transpeptidase YkuD (ErfK/YbiS/YcfS/YnhG family)